MSSHPVVLPLSLPMPIPHVTACFSTPSPQMTSFFQFDFVIVDNPSWLMIAYALADSIELPNNHVVSSSIVGFAFQQWTPMIAHPSTRVIKHGAGQLL
ncbi:hypothetical protein EV363DRAFT_1263940 [Boletus edulis]|nr:hypothetical protein EV363DRAFT_1263940 [Boletus edulis]